MEKCFFEDVRTVTPSPHVRSYNFPFHFRFTFHSSPFFTLPLSILLHSSKVSIIRPCVSVRSSRPSLLLRLSVPPSFFFSVYRSPLPSFLSQSSVIEVFCRSLRSPPLPPLRVTFVASFLLLFISLPHLFLLFWMSFIVFFFDIIQHGLWSSPLVISSIRSLGHFINSLIYVVFNDIYIFFDIIEHGFWSSSLVVCMLFCCFYLLRFVMLWYFDSFS